jgi:hypothetical protein
MLHPANWSISCAWEALPRTISATLVRTDHLELFRLGVTGRQKAPSTSGCKCGDGSVQRGAFKVEADGCSQRMRADTMLFLAAGEPHSIESGENSSVLAAMLAHRE